ncbi:MAG: glutamate cyclase domain-containing protein [Gemmataceae bacterium]
MTGNVLDLVRECVQRDVGKRGLATDPRHNLFNHCPGDFAASAASIADHPNPRVAILTGFYIPHANPPSPETDGPLGALFLARALSALGIPVVLLTDGFCQPSLAIGVRAAGLMPSEDDPVAVRLMTLPMDQSAWEHFIPKGWLPFALERFRISHLIAIERPGPSHTLESLQAQAGAREVDETHLKFLQEVPIEHQNRYHVMRGTDATKFHSPAHLLFESLDDHKDQVCTIGIGDGGNELGMGKIPWEVITRNVTGSGKTACRIATDYLLVAGLSNWGAYALATSVFHLKNVAPPVDLFSPTREEELLRLMVEGGPQVDGVLAYPNVSVDGLAFPEYIAPLLYMAELLER